MAEQTVTPDYAKLQKFVEAALTNPLHPVFKLGLSHSAILQHYATNVMLLGSVKGEQWFKDYPIYTAKLTEVMALCEALEPVKPLTEAAGDSSAIQACMAACKACMAACEKCMETCQNMLDSMKGG